MLWRAWRYEWNLGELVMINRVPFRVHAPVPKLVA